MERDFNSDEFEFFLKQKADQYKIYPSEKSWRNIHSSLHSRWKWFTLGGGLLLLTGLFFFSNDLTFSNSSKTSNNKILNSQVVTSSANSNSIQPFFSQSTQTLQPGVYRNSHPEPSLNNLRPDASVNPGVSLSLTQISAKKEKAFLNANVTAGKPYLITGTDLNDKDGLFISPLQEVSSTKNINVDVPVIGLYAEKDADLRSKVEMHIAPLIETEAALSGEINWMEEMTAIKLNAPKKTPFHLQFYFSPSVSYRRLDDNKPPSNLNQTNIPLSSSNSKVDRYVDHKPSIGAELGSNILFSAGRNLTFKTGLQLNYSRYTIKAYKFYFEKASIALNTLGPIGDTITAYTSFRNFSGYSPEDLQNQYLQVSVPIGAELKILGNKRLQLNIAGTIQPTYLLLNDTYLLSTDYVNYAKEPSLVRKWNVHTSMETFISYKMGGVRWQFGPQFRYQLMSSYNGRYPIKEYLFEYGIKLGVSKTLR